jgi:hypothetical protein
MKHRHRSGAVRTLRRWRPEFRPALSDHPPALGHAHRAMMLSTPAAARRQTRITICTQRKRRRKQWQAKHRQQHYGEQLSHSLD